jgi:hypothetical protein
MNQCWHVQGVGQVHVKVMFWSIWIGEVHNFVETEFGTQTKPWNHLLLKLFSYQSSNLMYDLILTEWVTKVKPHTNSFGFYTQLKNKDQPEDMVLMGAGLLGSDVSQGSQRERGERITVGGTTW